MAGPRASVDDRAWRVQEVLTQRGQHRGAGAVDLVVAATAELQGLTLLHRDRDFERIAAVTGQALQWYGPEAGKWTKGERHPFREAATVDLASAERASLKLCARAKAFPDWTSDRARLNTVPVRERALPTGPRARAHSVPVRADNHGQQRRDPTHPTARAEAICTRQSRMTGPSAVASQAESASSILVTRST